MTLPRLTIYDGALTSVALARWQERTLTLDEQSTRLDDDRKDPLSVLAWNWCGDKTMELIHALGFAIKSGMDTELHRDVGEYCVLFYPFDCPTGPLMTLDEDGAENPIEVKANRLVLLDCTHVAHQQVVPTDGSTRYSVAFKFRLPEEVSLGSG